jgi:Sec-independent protein translocase protein TatA
MGEITVILLLALIFLGPAKLPDLATGLGKLIRELRKATSDIKNEITLDDSFRKPFEELRDAVTLHPDELKRRDQLKKMVDEARLRDEAEAREAAAAAALAAVPAPAETGATMTEPLATASEPAPFDGQPLPPIPPAILQPAAPPIGTVSARSRPASGLLVGDGEAVEPTNSGGIMTSAPPPEHPAPATAAPEPAAAVPMTAPHSPSVSPPAGGPPTGGLPRVTPPISSLSGDRANVTQSLSEADLLPSAAPRSRKPTPPPLPGLERRPAQPSPAPSNRPAGAGDPVKTASATPAPPVGHLGAPRVTPPISSLSADRANVTQVLSDKDLLPSPAPHPAGAIKPHLPPPLPGSKKA